ncbi:MAG: hypothetical protein M0D57_06830 [Sphingobacteriales bacterium JAD_PAG50586_3]|nr:MAG: hypothetical protein M0D57_06830 [Sphingobacteriales bacterium JAD_PAG50586_3]
MSSPVSTGGGFLTNTFLVPLSCPQGLTTNTWNWLTPDVSNTSVITLLDVSTIEVLALTAHS